MKKLLKSYSFLILVLSLTFFPFSQSLGFHWYYDAVLNGSSEVPPTPLQGLGFLDAQYDDLTNILEIQMGFTLLQGPVTTANIHGPADVHSNAPVQIALVGFPLGVTAGIYSHTFILTEDQETMFLQYKMYVNINSSAFPDGEIRGQINSALHTPQHVYTLNVSLSGAHEVPPNNSNATASLNGYYDVAFKNLYFILNFSGVTSLTTAARLHGPAYPGENAPVQIELSGFPTGVSSGADTSSNTLTSEQQDQLFEGKWYVNIYSNSFPGGEIRAQLDQGTLPVELSVFASNVFKDNVTLKWTTTNEINNSGFDIERKLVSSTEWLKAGYIPGNGNTSEVKEYSFSERLNTGHYNYRLKQVDFNGSFNYHNLSNEVIVSLPSEYAISQNYPNPFNPTTKIDFGLPSAGFVNISVYDISGKEVTKIINDFKTAGYHTVNFDASNLSSGMYFYRMNANGNNHSFISTKKMLLLK